MKAITYIGSQHWEVGLSFFISFYHFFRPYDLSLFFKLEATEVC